MALSLAKSGYFNGNPEWVLNAPVDLVIHTQNYEIFTREYEETSRELNKERK